MNGIRIVGEIPNGDIVYFDKGRFDDWCVYLRRLNQAPFAPRDEWYFAELQQLAALHGAELIYEDFVRIYEATGPAVNRKMAGGIIRLSAKYGEDAHNIASIQTVIYAGMVAEERKENTKLGKRVKRLGMHQTLVEGLEPARAANFSRGMPWRDIARECEERGF